jgi:pimeloyl-ACP methyl ester carboxylesterase
MKTIFIVTGFKQKTDNVQFKWMRPFFKKLGYEVKTFAADWDHHVMSDYVAGFKEYYEKNKGKKNYVLGFSFGAMIALLSAKDLQPDRLYLCSLSPYFKEDMSKLRLDWQRMIGVRRKQDFLLHSVNKATKQLDVPTVVLYGETEGDKFPNLKKRCEKTDESLSKSRLIVVPDSPHKIDHPEYIKAIKALF